MPYFNFDNKRVWFKLVGRGKPLLFLPDNAFSSRMFNNVTKYYKKGFTMILIDLPGSGRSEKVDSFNADYWYYNSLCCAALLEHLNISRVGVIGTGGGAITAINLALEFPKSVAHVIADTICGDYPLPSYVERLETDRERDKKKFINRYLWHSFHGSQWRKVVDDDTRMQLEFYKTGKSFFHKPLSALHVPTTLTGCKGYYFGSSLEEIYKEMKSKCKYIDVVLFGGGLHPSIISNRRKFGGIVKQLFS